MDSWTDHLMVIGGVSIIELIVISIYNAITSPIVSEIGSCAWILTMLIPGLAYILPSVLLLMLKPGYYWGLGILINIVFGWSIIGYAIVLDILLFSCDYDSETSFNFEEYSNMCSGYLPLMKTFLKEYGTYEGYLTSYIFWYSYETDPETLKYKGRSAFPSYSEELRTNARKQMPDEKSKRLYSELTWLYKNNKAAYKTVAVTAYSELGKEYKDPSYKFKRGYHYPVPSATIKDQNGNTYQVYKN